MPFEDFGEQIRDIFDLLPLIQRGKRRLAACQVERVEPAGEAQGQRVGERRAAPASYPPHRFTAFVALQQSSKPSADGSSHRRTIVAAIGDLVLKRAIHRRKAGRLRVDKLVTRFPSHRHCPFPRGRLSARPMPDVLTFAVPKGRVLAEALPIMAATGVVPEAAFHDKGNRSLTFATNRADMRLIRVRAFDVATFVAHGAAQLGIVGSDVIEEFHYAELYAPVDLGIGQCHLAVAEPAGATAQPLRVSHLRVATKYPNITRRWFERAGVQAECVKLNGAMEIAPELGLAGRIVDLVSTGQTLRDNGLVETDRIAEVSSRLIINRAALKTDSRIAALIDAFRAAGEAQAA